MADPLQTRIAVIGSTIIALLLVSLLAISVVKEQSTNITVRTCSSTIGQPGKDGAPGDTGAPGATGTPGPPGSTGAPGKTGATGPAGAPGNTGATGATGAPGADGYCTTVTGAPGVNGVNAPMYHGSFYSTFTDQLTSRYIGQPMRLSVTEISDDVSLTDATNADCLVAPYCSAIRIDRTGIFDIQFSAQLFKTGGNIYISADIWLARQRAGESAYSDLPWTSTRVYVPNDTDYSVAAWNFMVSSIAGDMYQLKWSSSDALWANLRVSSGTPTGYPTGTVPPQIPGLILTVTSVSN